MLGDDFAFFLNEIPGCYFRLGAKNPNWERVPSLHGDRFDLDERSLPIRACILAHATLLNLSEGALPIRWLPETYGKRFGFPP